MRVIRSGIERWTGRVALMGLKGIHIGFGWLNVELQGGFMTFEGRIILK
jgi:hypothetical protein